ncbi:MAG TPA: hypothetical protein PKD26_06080 [Pyrinomonadaceae bacterium]|nr:hypothetical protein [Pyrinomonadaceae bacterium]
MTPLTTAGIIAGVMEGRFLIQALEASFQGVEGRSLSLVRDLTDELLYKRPSGGDIGATASCGEYLVRSAAAIEQVFGGITVRLWDDPFEWTLPEELVGCAEVEDYLRQCSETRRRGFLFFADDKELFRQIPAPDRLRPVIDVLLEALVRASHLQGRAFALTQYLIKSDSKPD